MRGDKKDENKSKHKKESCMDGISIFSSDGNSISD
jgi:hypothetical protein